MMSLKRCHWRLSLFGFATVALLVLNGTASAEIGFRRITPFDQMLDPVRFPPRLGIASAIWDSAAVDTTRPDTTTIDSLGGLLLDSLEAAPIAVDTAVINLADSLVIPPDTLIFLPDTTSPPSSGSASTEKPAGTITGTGSSGFKKGGETDLKGRGPEAAGEHAEEAPADSIAPAPYHPTNVGAIDLPHTIKATPDSITGNVVLSHRFAGTDIPLDGAYTPEDYLSRQVLFSDRENRRQSILGKLPKDEKKEGGALVIEIPLIKSQRAQRIFGGANIGLNVTGNIQIDGSLTREKKDELQQDNSNPTNYAFKINQKQQFNIKGKVGEKVSVEIDQDSEKLFEFENSLRVRYKGDEDEIIQSVEAGNVSLSLGGTKLATSSSNHKGLFGFKTESRLGALKLTTIASLDKGEKNTKRISGGSQKSEGIKIEPKDFVQGRYYFLDSTYRENYKYYNSDLQHVKMQGVVAISKLDVYKSVRNDEVNAVKGWAFANPNEEFEDGLSPDRDHQEGFFLRLEPGTDYTSDPDFGWIRLNRAMDNQSVLAVSYTDVNGQQFGEPDPTVNSEENPTILKLIQPVNPQPDDISTWKLMWRNVYDLHATGIAEETFNVKILHKTSENNQEDTHPVRKVSYLEIFDLDQQQVGGPGHDGRVDPPFAKLQLGELHFPDLQPFDPEGWFWYSSGDSMPHLNEIKVDSTDRADSLYTTVAGNNGLERVNSVFSISVQYSDASATYSLGFGVLDGSEEVLLNGRKLSRGSDYSIDYLSGSLTIINKDAIAAGADLEIKYETGQIFQLDTQTMLGLRAEYELWDNSYIGGTLLHLNQKTVEQRVRVGGEPKQNTVWDINTQLRFEPEFMTRAVDWLPLIETDAKSNITFSAEIAQVFPNPNSLNSPSTGDHNGVAYVDDFESVKRSTPLGITRRQWTLASFPLPDSRGQGRWERQRGRVIWYNPDQVKVTDIWPERETQAQNSTVQVLQVEFQPWWSDWGKLAPDGIEKEKSWGGLMRYLGPGYADQSQSKYIEIWLNTRGIAQGQIYFDLGRISEDVIPDGKSATEDIPLTGLNTGDGTVSKEEDIGIDKAVGIDPNDSAFVNGLDFPKLPSYDDWNPNTTGDKSGWVQINGTEGNGSKSPADEGGRIPDTEDLSGDGFPDGTNDFFRYRIDLSEGDLNRYIVGGQNNPKGWRLYRIPLTDTLAIGKPDYRQFDYVRFWFTGFRRTGSMMIAQMEIVGNEWREVKVPDERGGTRDPISIAVANTHDNPEYNLDLAPGVAGDVDPVTGLREKEQSLVLRINRLGAGEVGSAQKLISQKMNLLEYRQLKMFVHGGSSGKPLVDHFGRPLDLEMYFRFGSELPTGRAQPHYYEYSQRLAPGWDKSNEIILDLERLASLKFLRERDSTRDYDILPDGDVIRVVGSPSLRSIGFMEIGIKNHGQEITSQDGVEVWVNELRVSDIYRNPGWAATSQTSIEFADFFDMSASLTQRQADFHNLNERVRNDPSDQLTGDFDTNLQLGELFDKRLGIRIPVSFRFRQDVSIPKYKPNSDVKLTSVSGENPALWQRFFGDITSADRFRQTAGAEGPIDSLVSTDKQYTISSAFSKGRSDNLWLKYSLDNIKINGSFQEIWGRDYNSLLDYKKITNGTGSYLFAVEQPIELNWLGWASSVPVLNKLSESKFRPLPQSVNLSASGTETYIRSLRRTGVTTGDTTFNIDRSYSTSWRPFQVVNLDFSQTLGSSRVIDDTLRTLVASRIAVLDSSQFFTGPDSARQFDSDGWANAKAKKISQVKDKLFWKGFGYYFVDDELSQRASSGFNPTLLSWLGTETNYSTNYAWRWSQNLGPADRSVRASATFNATVTLRVPQLTANWRNVQEEGNKDKGEMGIMGGTSPGFKLPAGQKSGSLPEAGASEPSKDQKAPIPPEETVDSLAGIENLPPLIEPVPGDTDTLASAPPDTAVIDTSLDERPRRKPPNPLLLGKRFLSKLKDIQWSYTQQGDASNYGVAEGQANWAYRLGFSRDPGLATVPGYLNNDSYSQTFRNRFSTGYDITQNLTISNIEATFVETRSVGRGGENGSSSRPAFQYFDKDGITIKSYPAPNWGVRWSGWEKLPVLNNWTTSVSLDHSFAGSRSEQWRKEHKDSTKEIGTVAYEKNFQPLLGVTFAWKGGIGTTVRYNWTRSVDDQRTGNGVKNRSTTSSISVGGNYTSRKGFRIPIPVWPFKNRRFDNSTTFSLNFNSNESRRETLSRTSDKFERSPGGWNKSWSLTPSIDYTFSSTVRGGFRYTYSSQESAQNNSKSQEFGFTVNISIRG